MGLEVRNPCRHGQGSPSLAEAEMFLECECCILYDLDWETAHLAIPHPQRQPKINIA